MSRVSKFARIKAGIVLIILMFLSIAPIPISSGIGLYVVIFRPNWFKELVINIYADKTN
ncbi:hypothetical protein [Methylomonas sp. AM2-LC]|uniref:hypothetical protein n=1 Tax=Methylomonas sp. AM2-LC TaxID=3153301 RepID=UPI003264FE63